jgi:O-antigen/teichoic acid export membrane protein
MRIGGKNIILPCYTPFKLLATGMRRFFAKNLLFVIAVNLLVKPLWIFLIDRTVQNRVGHSSYGLYQALFNLGLIFQILLDFGINNYNSRNLAQYPRKLKSLFPAMLSARLVLSLLYLILICSLGFAFGYRGWQIVLLLGLLLIQCLSSILLFIRSNVSGLHKFKADGLLSVTDRLLMIIVCGFLLFYPVTARHFSIEWFVAAQILCYSLAIIIAIFVLKSVSNVRIRLSVDYQKVFSIIKESLPYALLILLMSIYTRADTLLVERLSGAHGSEEAGIYAAAYRLLDVGNMFGLMFATMLLPVFGRMLAQKLDVQPIVQLCVNLLLPMSLLIAVTGVCFSSEIMHMLYRQASQIDAEVFTWLMVAFPAFSLSNVYSTLLTANGDLRLLNRIAFFGVLINLTLNFILIPQYFSLGAAYSACITQSVLAICFMIFAQKQAQLPQNKRWAVSFVLFLLSIAATGYCVKQLPMSWMLQLALLFCSGLLLAFLFRFVSIRAAKALFIR